MVCGHRRAQCATGVTGCGLYPNILEGAIAKHFAAGKTIQRHAAGQAQIGTAAFFRQRMPVGPPRFILLSCRGL
jgi:hypothetical protein